MDQFMAVTGASASVAAEYLAGTDNDVATAVNHFFDSLGKQPQVAAPVAASAVPVAPPPRKATTEPVRPAPADIAASSSSDEDSGMLARIKSRTRESVAVFTYDDLAQPSTEHHTSSQQPAPKRAPPKAVAKKAQPKKRTAKAPPKAKDVSSDSDGDPDGSRDDSTTSSDSGSGSLSGSASSGASDDSSSGSDTVADKSSSTTDAPPRRPQRRVAPKRTKRERAATVSSSDGEEQPVGSPAGPSVAAYRAFQTSGDGEDDDAVIRGIDRYQEALQSLRQQEVPALPPCNGCVVWTGTIELACLAGRLQELPSLHHNKRLFHAVTSTLLTHCSRCRSHRPMGDLLEHCVQRWLDGKMLSVSDSQSPPSPSGDPHSDLLLGTPSFESHCFSQLKRPAPVQCGSDMHLLLCELASCTSCFASADLSVQIVDCKLGGIPTVDVAIHLGSIRPLDLSNAFKLSVRRRALTLVGGLIGYEPVAEYPHISADPWDPEQLSTVAAAVELCQSRQSMLHACEVQAGFPPLLAADTPTGVALPLKTHQRESVGWMLAKELVGTRDFVSLTTPDGHRAHINFINCQVKLQAPTDTSDHNCVVRGGVLADEMGLGKTLTVLSVIAANPAPAGITGAVVDVPLSEQTRGPPSLVGLEREISERPFYRDRMKRFAVKGTLVVLPVSISGQWESEAQMCFPSAKFLLYHGQKRNNYTFADIAAADIVVTTYETLQATIRLEADMGLLASVLPHTSARYAQALARRKPPRVRGQPKEPVDPRLQREVRLLEALCTAGTRGVQLTQIHFHRIVLDECQKCSTGVGTYFSLSATYRWAVSGTPLSTFGSFRDLLDFLGTETYGRKVAQYNFFSPFSLDGSGLRRAQADDERTMSDLMVDPALRAANSRAPKRRGERMTYGVIAMSRPTPPPQAYNTPMWALLLLAQQYMVRHHKTEEVLKEIKLPPRTVLVHHVTLSQAERQLYDRMETEIRAALRGLTQRDRLGNRVSTALQWVQALRRVATHHSLAKEVTTGPSEHTTIAENATRSITVMDVAAAEQHFRQREIHQDLFEALRKLAGDPPEFDECTVCLGVLQDPVVLTCGHMYCRECILGLLGGAQREKCPLCQRLTLGGPKVQLQVAAVAVVPAAEVDLEPEGPGAKIEALIRLVQGTLEADRAAKFVVFSAFPALLARAGTALAEQGLKSVVIDGSTTLPRRTKFINQFQADHGTKVCILSSRAGNAGLTLTTANHLILMEPNLNPGVDAQAMGRIHRFGQQRPVTIHRLLAAGTVDDRIQALLDKAMAGGVNPEDVVQSKTTGAEELSFIIDGDT